MKKKDLFAFIVLFAVMFFISAAQFNIEASSLDEQEKIVSGEDGFFMSPIWSPDGNYIAFTGDSYKGIWIKNLNTNEVKQLTNEDAAGYGYKWSPDSKAILSRVAKYDGMKRLNAVKMFFVDQSSEKKLTDYKTSMPGMPEFTSNGKEVYLYDGRKLAVFESGLTSNSLLKNTAGDEIVYVKNDKIFVGNSLGNNFNSFQPIKNSEYINVTVSPNGSKIAFEVYGGDLFIVNSNGTGLVDLGKGYRPQWSSDSKKIVYMVTKDDGENYTSSDIYIVNADGTQKIQLTDSENLLEMNPSFSPDGNYITYHEMNEGAIYILPVNLNQK